MKASTTLVALGFCAALHTPLLRSLRAAEGDAPPLPRSAKADGSPAERARSPRKAAQKSISVADEITATRRRIRDLERAIEARRGAVDDELKALQSQRKASARAQDVLNATLAAREQTLGKAKESVSEKEREVERLQGELSGAQEAMKGFVERLAGAITGGIPWALDRRKGAVARLRAIASAPESSPSQVFVALGRVQAEEEALGRLVEAGAVEVQLSGGEAIGVQGFRLGLLATVFASDDRKVFGFALPGQKVSDGIPATSENLAAPRGYLEALQVLRREKTPQPVQLFIPALRRESEDAR